MKRMFSLVLSAAAASSAHAGIAYDTLGASNSFQVMSWLIGEPTQEQKVAMQFQAWASGEVTQITLALTHYAFQNVYTVTLYADGCSSPGAVLEQWANVAAPEDSLLELVPDTTVELKAGFNYWVEVSAPLGGDNTVGGWNYDTIPSNNTRFAFVQGAGPWAYQCGERSALRVEIEGGGSGSSCVGDLDNSGVVDLQDMALFLAAFGTTCP